MHVQNDLRVFVPEAANDGGQNIARLGVGGGYGQRAAVLVRMLHGQLLQFVRLFQDGASDIDDRPPRRGDFRQALAVALKDLQTQLFLQQANLLADPRLGSVDVPGCEGHIQVAPGHFADVAQLLQFHNGIIYLLVIKV